VVCILDNKDFIFIVGDVTNFVNLAPLLICPYPGFVPYSPFTADRTTRLRNLIGFEWMLQ